MPIIKKKKPKKLKKALVAPARSKSKKTRNTPAYNALVINKKISAKKLKEVKKLGSAFNEFKRSLERFVQRSIK